MVSVYTICTRPATALQTMNPSRNIQISYICDWFYREIEAMEKGAEVCVQVVYAATIEILRKKIVSNIAEGDVDLGQLRSALMREFEILKESIEALRTAPLTNAENDLKLAFNALAHNQQRDAQFHFEEVKKNANDGFSKAINFSGKLLATKLHILSFMYTNRFFDVDANFAYIGDQCAVIFDRLCSTNEVKSAIASRGILGSVFGTGSGNGSNRNQYLTEVALIRRFIFKFTGKLCAVPGQDGKPISLASYMDARIHDDSFSKYSTLTAEGNLLLLGAAHREGISHKLLGTENSGDTLDVLSMDPQLKICGVSRLSVTVGSVVLATSVANGDLFIATKKTLEKWNLSNFSLVSCVLEWPCPVFAVDLWAEKDRLIVRCNRENYSVIPLSEERGGGGGVVEYKVHFCRDVKVTDSSYHQGHIYSYKFRRSTDITKLCLNSGDTLQVPSGLSCTVGTNFSTVGVQTALAKGVNKMSKLSVFQESGLSVAASAVSLISDNGELPIGVRSIGFNESSIYFLSFDLSAGKSRVMAVELHENASTTSEWVHSDLYPIVNTLLVKNGLVFVYNPLHIYVYDPANLVRLAHIEIPTTSSAPTVLMGHCLFDINDTSIFSVVGDKLYIWDVIAELKFGSQSFQKSVVQGNSVPPAIRSFLQSNISEKSSTTSEVAASGLAAASDVNIIGVVKTVVNTVS